MPQRTLLWILLLTLTSAYFLAAQDVQWVAPLRAQEKADALFVASVPALGEKDESGMPALATLDPVAFLVKGQLRGCYKIAPSATEGAEPEAVDKALKAFYAQGLRYDLWSGGALWGVASVTKSCMEELGSGTADLEGCFEPRSLKGFASQVAFKGLSWTGPALTATHANDRRTATAAEKESFLEGASRIYAEHHVPVKPNSIHVSRVVHTRLRADAEALAANMIVQLADTKPLTVHNYRMLLVLEGAGDGWYPVLVQFRRGILTMENETEMPKGGTLVPEEASIDREVFVDSLPLYADESDAIVTMHEYYEDWAYSLYRRVGNAYKLQYTGCGGGV